ncbi:mCG147687 [Mus musculus]|nr:mCG147687 [Mus musculus]
MKSNPSVRAILHTHTHTHTHTHIYTHAHKQQTSLKFTEGMCHHISYTSKTLQLFHIETRRKWRKEWLESQVSILCGCSQPLRWK